MVQCEVSAADVLDSLRELAISSHGVQAKSVLNSWGIGKCTDFGEIVFNLVEVNLLGKGADDSKEDFNAGYDFDEVSWMIGNSLRTWPAEPSMSQG